MASFPKKVKISANLVRRENEKHYRVLDDEQMCRLKISGRVVPEGKMTENRDYIIGYYIEVV